MSTHRGAPRLHFPAFLFPPAAFTSSCCLALFRDRSGDPGAVLEIGLLTEYHSISGSTRDPSETTDVSELYPQTRNSAGSSCDGYMSTRTRLFFR
jgi:hypothetical protein